MREIIDARIWDENHERFTEQLGQGLSYLAARFRPVDPAPLIARALSLVLAVSLTSLTLGATFA